MIHTRNHIIRVNLPTFTEHIHVTTVVVAFIFTAAMVFHAFTFLLRYCFFAGTFYSALNVSLSFL